MIRSCCLLLLSAACCCVSGCAESETPPPTLDAETRSAEQASANADTTATGRQAFAGLEFDVPDSWQAATLSPMQMGILAAKFTAGESEDVTITLSRSAGGLQANLDRWRGQVTLSEAEQLETLSIAGTESTLIKLTGQYSPGMGRPDLPDGCLLGVIIPQPQQDYFIKATGPAASVNSIEDAFRDFVLSAEIE